MTGLVGTIVAFIALLEPLGRLLSGAMLLMPSPGRPWLSRKEIGLAMPAWLRGTARRRAAAAAGPSA